MTSGPTYVRISAETTDLTAQLAVAKADFSAFTAELKKNASAVREAGSAAGDGLKLGLQLAAEQAAASKAEVSKLSAELRKLNQVPPPQPLPPSFLGSFLGFKEALTGIAEAMVAAFAVERIASWDEKVAESGAHMAHLGQEVGLSVEKMSELAGEFGAMGLEVDKAGTLIDRLEKSMIKAESGTGKEAAAFKALGISAAELKGLSIDEVLNRMADAFQASADGPEKVAIAMAVAGRGAADLIPFLDRGREGMEEFKKVAEETGTVITGPMAEGMERTKIEFSELDLATKGLGISFFEVFKPATDAIVKGLTEFIEAINTSIKQGGVMADVVKVIAAGFNGIVIVVSTVSFEVREMWNAITTGAKAASKALHGDFSGALADLKNGWTIAKKEAEDYYHSVTTLLANKGSDLGATGDGKAAGDGKPKLDASGLENPVKVDKNYEAQWKEQLQNQLLELQLFGQDAEAFELKFWKDRLQEAIAGGAEYASARRSVVADIYGIESEQYRQALAAQKKATEDRLRASREEVTQVKADFAEIKQAADGYFSNYSENIKDQIAEAKGNFDQQRELALEWVAEAKKVYGDNTQNYRAALQEMRTINAAEVAQLMKPWEDIVHGIGGSFKTMFDGILQGTQTFRQMLGNLATNLITTFAQMGIKMVENYAIQKIREMVIHEQAEATKVAATAAGEEAQVAVKAAAATEGKAVEAAAGSASVLGDANRAAAGAYAAVVGIPYIGPVLAPVAAATAFVAVSAFDLFSAAGGMDIGSGVNPITQLHSKEMVLPANIAEGIRGMIGNANGGGSGVRDVYLQPQMLDAKSLVAYLNDPTALRALVSKLRVYLDAPA